MSGHRHERITSIIAAVEKHAHETRSSPSSDRILCQVEWFNAGRAYQIRGAVPAGWNTYAVEIDRAADPEYTEYLRLQKKFEKEIR